ncbi:MAG: HAMP domain-containing protein [Alphaproteobacteria bacterium]|nr:HAMP domain-containing protein [Alphaproteobacteria bacterium]
MLRRYLPRSLYARIVLIVILPIFLMQSVITYIFFERHWDLVTANLSANVAGQVALVTRLYGDNPNFEDRQNIEQWVFDDLDLKVRFDANIGIPEKDKLSIFNIYNSTFDRQLERSLENSYWFNTQSWPAFVEIRVQLEGGQLVFFAYRDRVFATTGPIFLFWLISTSILLGAIAIVFLRNQVRSILRLANAAEAFGRGRDAPDYRPTGATEVRKAGHAFIAMRERIKRHLEQRTSMLAGVSHDLRTPLTRIKLALAMQPDSPEVNDLRNDVLEMEHMVEAYLEFARNEAADEEPNSFDLAAIINEVAHDTKRSGHVFHINIPKGLIITARRYALKRAIDNLVNNGLRHATNVWVSALGMDRHIEIYVDDDGPGMDPEFYKDAFKPFTRLDEARNLNASGMGLGLAVVRDMARSHGGDVTLDRSEHGGLRATIRLPV